MSIYDVDYNTVATEMLPPDKRTTGITAFVKALLTGVQYNRDLVLDSYRNGNAAALWNNVTTYAKGARVSYLKSIYESLVGGNTDQPPSAKWIKVQDNFIGLSERVYFNTQKIVFEWAINRWFLTTFRQPPAVSDIFVSLNAKSPGVFRVGGIEQISSVTFYNASSEYVINTFSFAVFNNITINVPVAVYNALDSLPANRDKIIRAFADLYMTAGINYNVVTY